jgi:hypothetical protein
MKVEFYRRIFEKYPNIKFHENPSSGSGVVLCGRAYRHDQANSLRTRQKTDSSVILVHIAPVTDKYCIFLPFFWGGGLETGCFVM